MSKKDYELFLYKIDQLNKLVESVKESPEKYNLVINCKSHQDIVELANKWGYKIGQRWGDY